MIRARLNWLRWGLLASVLGTVQVNLDTAPALAQQGIILTTLLGESPQNIDVTESGGMPTAMVSITCCEPDGVTPVTPQQGTAGEAVENLINDLVIFTGAPPNLTKWNDLQGDLFMIPVEIQLSQPRTVRYYTLTSANDSPERDPYEWRLMGTNVDNPTPADFVVLEERTGVEYTAFHQTQLFGPVTNNTAYKTYRFEFETQYVAQGAANYPAGLAIPNSIQLAEVELFENFAGGGAKLLIDRATGVVRIQNAGTSALDITGYSITSNAGTLNSNVWTSITDTADGNSGGSLDTDNWIRLTDPNGRRDLSEVEDPNGTGGISLAPAGTINLGAAWIKYPTEDVVAEALLADGTTIPLSVTYETGSTFRFGDLNFSGGATPITITDWNAFKNGQAFNFSTAFSAAESYAKGDLDGDFDHDLTDYALFKAAYDSANGAGAFVAMVASVPEPCTLGLLAIAAFAAAATRVRRQGVVAAALAVLFFLGVAQPSQAGQVLSNLLGFDLTDPDNVLPTNVTITAGDEAASPAAEMPPMAVDSNRNTKWLAFQPSGTFYQIQFNNNAQHAVDAYTISSANDTPNRDPYQWTLSGSNDGSNFTVIDTQMNQDFVNRFETQLFTFTNATAYNTYRFDFLTEFGATGNNEPNSIQLSEIELFDFAAPLTLEVNRATGALRIVNNDPGGVPIDAYRILSPAGALNRDAWWGAGALAAANGGQSIHDQTIAGFPRGNGTGNGWEEGPGSTNNQLVEWFLGNSPAGQGSSTLTAGQSITMNNIYQVGGAEDIAFDYRSGGRTLTGVVQYIGTPAGVTGDYNGNGVVDAADYVLWRNGGPLQNDPTPGVQSADYDVWRANFGRTPAAGGSVAAAAAVPEPATWLLTLVGPALLFGRRRRPANPVVVEQNQNSRPVLRRSAMVIDRNMMGTLQMTAVLAGCLLMVGSAAGSTLDRNYRLGDDPLENAVVGQPVGSATVNPPGAGFTLDSATPFQDLSQFNNPTYANTQATGRPGAAANERGVNFNGTNQYLSGAGLGSPREGGAAIGRPNYANNRMLQAWIRPTLDSGTRQDVISDTFQFGVFISATDRWGHTYGGDTATGIGNDFTTTAPVAYNQWTHVMQRTFDNDGVVLYVNGVAVDRFNAGYNQVTGSGDQNIYVGAGTSASNFFAGQVDNIKLHVSGVFVPEPPDPPIPVQWGDVNIGTENDFIASQNLVTGDVNGDGLVNGTGSGPAATDDVRFFIDHWLDERRVNNFLIGDIVSRTTMGDLNFDGRTSLSDWSILRNAHAGGASLNLASLLGTTVPEPSALLLAALGILPVWGGSRRRRR